MGAPERAVCRARSVGGRDRSAGPGERLRLSARARGRALTQRSLRLRRGRSSLSLCDLVRHRSRTAELVTTAGGGTGAAVGAFATHEPLLLLTVPVGIILCRAAWHVGDGIGIALRTLILRLVGAEDEPPAEPPHEAA